jgi:hypothetical protein
VTDNQQHAGRGWRDRAACRDVHVDPELFYPAAASGTAYDAQVASAKAVCARCPVIAECLAEALLRIPHGIAGGMTEHERRQLRRDHTTRTAGTGAATVVDEVLADGPPPGMTARERAGVGRTLLAAGRSTRHVAGAFGVCTRTVERQASTGPSSTATSSTSSSDSPAEGSRGGNRAPLLISHTHNTRPGNRTQEGLRS